MEETRNVSTKLVLVIKRGLAAVGFARALAIVLLAISLSAACSGDSDQLPDPAVRGEYGVGVTERTFTRTSSTTGEPRVLETVIWYPIDETGSAEPVDDAPPAMGGAPFPVLTFSHGDGNEPRHASYFTEHLASWGFVVVAPPHPGNTEDDCPCSDESKADSYQNRVPDILFALDGVLALQDEPSDPVGSIVDAARVGSIGYSLGGFTSVATAPEERFDVIVALAPGAPTLFLEVAADTDVPVFVAGAGKDHKVDPVGLRRLYDAYPSDIPHYFLFMPEAGHHAFRDECNRDCEFSQDRAHELVKRYVTAFLLTHLQDKRRVYRVPSDHYRAHDCPTYQSLNVGFGRADN